MPNKEERILILTGKNGEEICTKMSLRVYPHNNFPCHKCQLGMTRAEAVERMAKAIYFKACGTIKHYAKCKKEYIPFAEASLDAILGGKNG